MTYSYVAHDIAALGTVCAILALAPRVNPANPSFAIKHFAVEHIFAYFTATSPAEVYTSFAFDVLQTYYLGQIVCVFILVLMTSRGVVINDAAHPATAAHVKIDVIL